MPTVIVHGPQACGKTRNAEALRAKFGCTGIVDDFGHRRGDTIVPGHLHLSNEPLAKLEKFDTRNGRRVGDVEIVAFDKAIQGVQ